MYRVCESFAVGGVNPYMYGILLQRYQNILVGLIAIEQLTTAVAKSDIKISGQPDDKSGSSKKGSVGEQKNEEPSGNTSGKNKIDANTDKSKNETPATQESGNEEQSGTDTADILRTGTGTNEAMANTVRDIVGWIVNKDNSREYCIHLLTNPIIHFASKPSPALDDFMQIQIQMRQRCLWILDPPNTQQIIAEIATTDVRKVLGHLQPDDIHLFSENPMPENHLFTYEGTETVDQWKRLIAIGLAKELTQKELEDYNKEENEKIVYAVRITKLGSRTHEFLIDYLTEMMSGGKIAAQAEK